MYRGETFTTIEQFFLAVDDYIFWYNNARIQKRIKDLAPIQYRSQVIEVLTDQN